MVLPSNVNTCRVLPAVAAANDGASTVLTIVPLVHAAAVKKRYTRPLMVAVVVKVVPVSVSSCEPEPTDAHSSGWKFGCTEGAAKSTQWGE